MYPDAVNRHYVVQFPLALTVFHNKVVSSVLLFKRNVPWKAISIKTPPATALGVPGRSPWVWRGEGWRWDVNKSWRWRQTEPGLAIWNTCSWPSGRLHASPNRPAVGFSASAAPTAGKEPSPSSLALGSFPIGQKQKSGPRSVHRAQQDMAKAWQQRKQQTKGCRSGVWWEGSVAWSRRTGVSAT